MDEKIWKSYTCLWMEKSESQAGAYGWQFPEHIYVIDKSSTWIFLNAHNLISQNTVNNNTKIHIQ